MTTCEDCGRPNCEAALCGELAEARSITICRLSARLQSVTGDAARSRNECEDLRGGLELATSRIVELEAALGRAERECGAWRALAEHMTADGICGSFPYKNIHGRWYAYTSAKADTNYGLDVVADTPQAAAVDLATKLGLLDGWKADG